MNAKQRVADYWEAESCGTGVTNAPKHSRAYFDEIEEFRYSVEPEIFAFAQFTRHYGQKMLEVGVGAGSDFLQWVRAGTAAHGIDLTREGVENVRQRLAVYGLRAADLRQADAEAIPHPDNTFDLVYSWGVIHHSPDTEKAFAEIVRVTKPGGTIKVMVYNRRSLQTFYTWVRHALLKGKPWRSFAEVLSEHMESPGTKGYTRSEVRAWASRHRLTVSQIDASASPFYDLLDGRGWAARTIATVLATLAGRSRCGWFLRMEAVKSPRGG